ncbi:MAG: hypothetical protein PHV34_19190 [Verrucomicrobiae bacterium]|nr:hypothetical protein [Verrucomicrobiae bacterium]
MRACFHYWLVALVRAFFLARKDPANGWIFTTGDKARNPKNWQIERFHGRTCREVLHLLEEAGMIERKRSEKDARLWVVRLIVAPDILRGFIRKTLAGKNKPAVEASDDLGKKAPPLHYSPPLMVSYQRGNPCSPHTFSVAPNAFLGGTSSRTATQKALSGETLLELGKTLTASMVFGNSYDRQRLRCTSAEKAFIHCATFSLDEPRMQRSKKLCAKARSLSSEMAELHWENCKVRYDKHATFGLSLMLLESFHDAEKILSAYASALRWHHGITTDKILAGKCSQNQKASPALTLWKVKKLLAGDGRTAAERRAEFVQNYRAQFANAHAAQNDIAAWLKKPKTEDPNGRSQNSSNTPTENSTPNTKQGSRSEKNNVGNRYGNARGNCDIIEKFQCAGGLRDSHGEVFAGGPGKPLENPIGTFQTPRSIRKEKSLSWDFFWRIANVLKNIFNPFKSQFSAGSKLGVKTAKYEMQDSQTFGLTVPTVPTHCASKLTS